MRKINIIKKYFWQIIVFFIIAITSGIMLANHEAQSTSRWDTFTSTDAGLTFKHPKSATVVEDKGWRITVSPSKQQPENNIKILYSYPDLSAEEISFEEQFLANCQPTRVSEISTQGGRIKVFEDSTCNGQTISTTVIVYADNGMTYDIGLFGEIDRKQLYQFFSTFTFGAVPPAPTSEPIISDIPNPVPTRPLNSNAPGPIEEATICTMDAKICPDGSTVGRSGPKCEFKCP